MKSFKKMMALAIVMVMTLALALPAMAAPGDAINATTGTITVENAAKGETYKLYKIFGATISKESVSPHPFLKTFNRSAGRDSLSLRKSL